MKRSLIALTTLIILSLACNLSTPAAKNIPAANQSVETITSSQPDESDTCPGGQCQGVEASQNDSDKAILLFDIGMHIEPFGETAQGYSGGKGGDYHQPVFFDKQVGDILTVTQIVESHHGHMTIQAQSPFTQVAVESGNTILADLASRGHEIALHFHEDAHMGKNPENLNPKQWCDVLKEEIGYIQQSSGMMDIRYWSGGNLYPDIYEAATCAGLNVNSDWKNPQVQETDLSLVGVNPWRPAGGTDGIDFTLFTQHDPNGKVVFLPEGQYDATNFAAQRRSEDAGGDEAYFEYLKSQLYASLKAADANKVNVFHFTVHPGEFRGDPQHPFEVVEKFLTEVVDPLVASDDIQWATYSEMADAYAAWESANPGIAPK